MIYLLSNTSIDSSDSDLAARLEEVGEEEAVVESDLSETVIDTTHTGSTTKKYAVRVSLLSPNWLFETRAHAIYREYLELDQDQNGMLSKAELKRFRTGSSAHRPMHLTHAFIDRIFEELVTYHSADVSQPSREQEMDYRVFLDLVLAVDSLKQTASSGDQSSFDQSEDSKSTNQHTAGLSSDTSRHNALLYFWNILDINKVGYIDVFILKYFFRDIEMGLEMLGYESVKGLDVMDEILDMVAPAQRDRITFDDLTRCGMGSVVVTILIDVEGFWNYEQRGS